jgi:hypothetical protein
VIDPVRCILAAAAVVELRQRMDRLDPVEEYSDSLRGKGEGEVPTKVLHNAFNRHPLLLSYLDRPGVLDLVEAIHGEDAHVMGMTIWLTGPLRSADDHAKIPTLSAWLSI